jgi:hypothetical protein
MYAEIDTGMGTRMEREVVNALNERLGDEGKY